MKTTNELESTAAEAGEPRPGVPLERLVRLSQEMRTASAALCEATAEELPIGTVIAATLGRSRIVGKVIGHAQGWHSYYAGTVIVANIRTGKERRVSPCRTSSEVTIISKPNGQDQERASQKPLK